MPAALGPAPADCPSVLVIDDDPLISVVVRRALEGINHRMRTALDGKLGLDAISTEQPDVIVLDNVLPDGLGVEVLEQIHQLAPNVPVLFVTARGSGSTAIEAMKLCAFDYLPKPLDPPKLKSQIRRALSLRQLIQSDPTLSHSGDARSADAPTEPPPTSDALVGECPAMQSVFKAIGKVASQNVAVLLRGEHGTGKEAIAREIHFHSQRKTGPLVKIHCPAFEERQLELEIFGTESQPGKIEEAAGGTLVLQEIGGLGLSLQSKLLPLFRDGAYLPVGGAAPRRADCRVISITGEPLEARVRSGDFRSDLYYTLGAFVITLPPLRQRRGDLPLLIAHSLNKLRPIYKEFGVEQPRVSEAAMQSLCSHVWPGNIDELESVLKRALVEQKGHILLAADLRDVLSGDPVVQPSEESDDGQYTTDWVSFAQLRIDGGTDTLHADAIEEAERKLFARVLSHTGGNQAHAARLLGITRASLRKKLRMYSMAPKPSGDS
ncbi:Nitrogen assimilation regulatory protein [Posidoniimonas corsicana]|uniref:DNA-binding transcriptional regulator NtrC n=1 Tax=Posidoniimonas corsicana TaxID=1938618 RepID=A0A5C5UXJ8_9BACT|nr:sigma-54 dependent transcriptional regulator [Posidoniimonas corsicana]TWT31086.1 Nitrogen assimilation regulatory protein [Posidoniimonas corsicana]